MLCTAAGHRKKDGGVKFLFYTTIVFSMELIAN